MKLGYSTWGMPEVPIDEALDCIKGLGYDGFELTVIPGYTTDLDKLDASEVSRIKRLIIDHDLEMPAISAHRSFLEENPRILRKNMDQLKKAIDLALELNLGVEPPAIITISGGHEMDWDDVKDILLDRTRELVDYASMKGVIIAMEPHIFEPLDSPDKVLWLIEKVGSPFFKINFDISHFDVLGLSIEETVPLLVPHSAHTHVKDQKGRLPNHEFLIPGEGEFDYVSYLKAVQSAGYDGFVTVEVSVMVQRRPDYDPFAAAELSYKTLSQAFEKAGIERKR
jgi:sugar phosphate isomerase/epimerase